MTWIGKTLKHADKGIYGTVSGEEIQAKARVLTIDWDDGTQEDIFMGHTVYDSKIFKPSEYRHVQMQVGDSWYSLE